MAAPCGAETAASARPYVPKRGCALAGRAKGPTLFRALFPAQDEID